MYKYNIFNHSVDQYIYLIYKCIIFILFYFNFCILVKNRCQNYGRNCQKVQDSVLMRYSLKEQIFLIDIEGPYLYSDAHLANENYSMIIAQLLIIIAWL